MTAGRILIVEDERVTAEDLREILTQLGHTVTAVVSTAVDAIREAEQGSPDLALMDIHIQGDMDGVEAARILRRRFDIPVVYLTAHADLETLSRARLAEPLGYVIKPFQETELQASVEMALYKQRIDRESKQRQRQLSGTLNAIGEGVISIDCQEAVTLLNSAAEAWTGWKEAEALGRKLEEVFRLRPPERLEPIRRVLSAGRVTSLEPRSMLAGRNGEERAVAGSVAPVWGHTGSLSGAVIVFGAAKEEPSTTSEPQRPAATPAGFEMVLESQAMKQVMSLARRVAASEVSTVLIDGESGAGKDVLARYLHHQSSRSEQPFLAINCASIPETLIESELFGYEKGAFTDARQQKRGVLELASGGTVFFDEIGEMPLALQAKLLRVLEEQTFRRLGGVKDIQVDLRIIAATNRDLREAIRDGRFRLDLYYRLNVIQLTIPPLRERRDAILPLARYFLRTFNQRFKRQLQGFSPHAEQLLLAHDWPGNVREVRNAVERAMVVEEGSWIQPESLGLRPGLPGVAQTALAPASPPTPGFEGMSLGDAERTMLVSALVKTGWNQTRAARLLGVTRDTLRYKMKKFNLKEERPD
ncbi:MAG TPA: sigma 54-interacting transcriptional regulator [Bryobacteraceae bacterium]|jgi:PAS domain S-box-containing protein|nr:sigma 54-interacting transcriptional regulator [Bryobacteraceae bacterium]